MNSADTPPSVDTDVTVYVKTLNAASIGRSFVGHHDGIDWMEGTSTNKSKAKKLKTEKVLNTEVVDGWE